MSLIGFDNSKVEQLVIDWVKIPNTKPTPNNTGLSQEQLDNLTPDEQTIYMRMYNSTNSQAVNQLQFESTKRSKITENKVNDLSLNNMDNTISNNTLNSKSDTLSNGNITNLIDSANPVNFINKDNSIIFIAILLITGYIVFYRKG